MRFSIAEVSDPEEIEAHLGLVRAIAKTVKRRAPRAELDELVSVGVIGLAAAMRHFDPAAGVPFGAYASFRIRGSMLDFVRWYAKRHDPLVDLKAAASVPSSENLDELAAGMQLRAKLAILNPREREVIEKHDLEGVRLAAIAREWRRTPGRAAHVRDRALEKLRGAMAA